MGQAVKQYYQVPAGTEDSTFRNIVSAAYTAYVGYKRMPSVEDIAEFSKHEKRTINRIIATPEFKTAIQSRGVPWDGLGGLSTEQHYALSILLNPTDRRTLQAKLKSCGITYPKYKAWLKEPKFSNYIKQQADEMLADHEADFHTVLASKGLNGDLNAIKYIYELTGRHNPQNNQVVDLQRVVGLLLEVITRHVTDATVLSQIVADITNVMPSGGTVPGQVVPSITTAAPVGPTFEDFAL